MALSTWLTLCLACSGILLGTTLSRISAGLFDHYTSYRWAYALWAALQLFSAFLCYVALPDYPAKTTPEQREPYWSGTMKGFALAPFKEPVLLQYTLVCMLVFVAYETFWTSTTFFASEVYHLSSLSISLLSLIIFSCTCIPLICVGHLNSRQRH
jgi:Na+/melibiose symporter-like transporter